MLIADRYERRTRLTPGLLVVLPVAFVVVGLGLKDQPVLSVATGLLSAVGLPVLLASTVRVRGLAVQSKLFGEWGCSPTTASLRHYGHGASSHQRHLWRTELSAATGHELPTSETELADPPRADAKYESAVSRLREMTRDRKQFPLIFEENCNYGFERNLLGVRRIGLVMSLISVAGLVAAIVVRANVVTPLSLQSLIIALVLDVLLLAMWLLAPSAPRARVVGFRYAERLLNGAAHVKENP